MHFSKQQRGASDYRPIESHYGVKNQYRPAALATFWLLLLSLLWKQTRIGDKVTRERRGNNAVETGMKKIASTWLATQKANAFYGT